MVGWNNALPIRQAQGAVTSKHVDPTTPICDGHDAEPSSITITSEAYNQTPSYCVSLALTPWDLDILPA